ncbi:MAG: flagellar FliJ family protein [Phenylobacterium sp.]|uniref:flagellar FliJ family protein n=1 Tax=Phenylobacterium sp. TaxID=1871053 RepID=UPI00273323F9|nr:flagellar FliJ family protein [Phenylobacterium sp.]MDP3174703.1 flagellar FliJ family protein [Phenylobacterium sp.]
MSWAQSLIRLSTYEVEVLQKRLSEIADARAAVEVKRALLDAEGEAEALNARDDAEAGWCHIAFMDALRVRKAQADAHIALLKQEEEGARDALNQAFETQKKYEHVAENIQLTERKEVAKREIAMLDDLGLRRVANSR